MEKFISTFFIFTAVFLNTCSDDAQEPQIAIADTVLSSEEKVSENIVPKMKSNGLNFVWETQGFNNPESVIYDESTGTLVCYKC